MTSPTMSSPTADQVSHALAGVNDPEIRRPITELGMVKTVDDRRRTAPSASRLLTVAGCPMRETITRDVTAAVRAWRACTGVQVELGVMSDEQRTALQTQLRGDRPRERDPVRPARLADPRVRGGLAARAASASRR